MYPETSGVPLEEMDAVFGEGMETPRIFVLRISKLFAEELEERLEDEESERASLFSRRSSRSRRSRQSLTARGKSTRPGFFGRLFGRSEHRASYEPIRDGEGDE